MDDPIKIIFKYKNANRRVHYNTYVFIGDIPNNILKILKKIEDKQLYESLIALSPEEIKVITKYYGAKWYNKFFNTYHINHSIDLIRKNKKNQDGLIDKYGKEWYDEHIKSYELIEKRLLYSYDTLIRDEIQRREFKKKKRQIEEVEQDIDYTTKRPQSDIIFKGGNRDINENPQKIDVLKEVPPEPNEDFNMEIFDKMAKYDYRGLHDDIMMNGKLLKGELTGGEIGRDDGDDIDIGLSMVETEDDSTVSDKEFEKKEDFDEDEPDITPAFEDEETDELNIEDLEKIYQDNDVVPDSNISQTSTLIREALNDDKIFKKTESKSVDFDTSKDNLAYDESLKNVYQKYYVGNNYIFKDDTIKTIKNKICASIYNNSKFEKEALIAPSRQYLWSEYFYDDKSDRIMIGQKWIKRSELLHIDVEPNPNLRVYEELRGKLKFLKDNIRRYGSKIKREDDDFNILYDYEGYYTNNELYMIDIYNELGKGFNTDPESLKNIIDVYIRIYFPRIKPDDIKYIMDYLNGDTKVESNKNKTIHDTIINDLIIENEIMKDMEVIKKNASYKNFFGSNYITQSVIHVNLKVGEGTKIDLFRIFNEFMVDQKYPFIQYQTVDGQIIFKYDTQHISEFSNNRENIDVLSKWFETAPYGISFKVRITEKNNEKFMAINLSDNGRIEYKTQWKEDDMATLDDIRNTYEYVKDLIKKINSERNKVQFVMPINEEFKYAFINTIQKFELPDKYIINHNDLSEFSRYFYPYVALVVEPRKRQSKTKKVTEKGKYGTYLRYKRVSRYENQNKIEQRVLYLIKNYDYNDQSLGNEISKQFNITMERASEEIERVKLKYPSVKKSRKLLKKIETVPKYKPPGIGIDIQGKQRDRYKIRISGARTKDQLDRIIVFYSILVYLYVETYLYKNPERQILKDKLKKLTNIARRRNKVDDIVNYEQDAKAIKQMGQLDKKRIGFKPDKGQNQWSRSCQNSGHDKKRRPQQFMSVDNLLKQGFKLNKLNGIYEKKAFVKSRGGKKKEILIRAVGLDNIDDEGNTVGSVYYSCNPDENADHMYVGFLSRSNNPYGQCMPCCFKKDALESKNKQKMEYYMKCIGKGEKVERAVSKNLGDKLYILQDTNKIQEGRVGFLPKYLDYFFNEMLNKTRKIKHHYLLNSETGYYFKYGSKQEEYPFLNAIAAALEMTVVDIKDKIIDRINKDKSDMLFTALNNGDIKTSFETREKYADFIRTNNNLGPDSMSHIMTIPGVLKPTGLNIVIFRKETIIIKKTLEKEKIRDDFVISCQNVEELNNIKDNSKDSIILIKENKNYYPIVLVIKKNIDKNFSIIKLFKFENVQENILNHIYDFYDRNCHVDIIGETTSKIIAKDLYKQLSKLNNKEFMPHTQLIDARNKCKYIVINSGLILPVKPSGSIYDLQIIKTIDNKLQTYDEAFDSLQKLYDASKKGINIKPIGVYYNFKTEKGLNVIGIMTSTYDLAPIKPLVMNIETINNKNLAVEYKQLFDKVDSEIAKGKENYKVDERIIAVKHKEYENESYELFRLHLSEYLEQPDNINIKKKFIKIISDVDIPIAMRRDQIKMILFRIIDRGLQMLYEKTRSNLVQEGGKYGKLVHVINKLPNVENYTINNNREVCTIHKTKDQCIRNLHCHFSYDECNFALTREMIITFVNKISEELTTNEHKAAEILKKDNYFVSDIANYNVFEERPRQRIIKSTNSTINNVLTDLFGKENMPKIGKRKMFKTNLTDLQDMNMQNPLQNMGDFSLQKIIENNISLLRAYANCYTWLKHSYYETENRNLGYYSELQTDMANYFRSNIIDWLTDKNNRDVIVKELDKYLDSSKRNFIYDFINKLNKDTNANTTGIVEYFVLNKIHKFPVIVYDKHEEIIYVIDDGVVYDRNLNKTVDEKYKNQNNLKKFINIRFISLSMANVPVTIEAAYF
jgi:hypothetical protein